MQLGAFSGKDSDDGEFIGEIEPTDPDGRTSAENVSTDRELTACATHKEYQRACTARFSVAPDAKAAVTIHLTGKDLRHGQITVPEPLTWGRIYFVRVDGTVSEWVQVGRDGGFSYHDEHRPPEYVVLASSAPLLVASLPDVSADDLRIEFPSGAVVDIEVEIGPHIAQQDARLGLVIGGRHVPSIAYGMHQSARGLQPNLYHRGPLRIPAVLMSATPVTVVLGPPPDVLPPGVPEGMDVFCSATIRSAGPQF